MNEKIEYFKQQIEKLNSRISNATVSVVGGLCFDKTVMFNGEEVSVQDMLDSDDFKGLLNSFGDDYKTYDSVLFIRDENNKQMISNASLTHIAKSYKVAAPVVFIARQMKKREHYKKRIKELEEEDRKQQIEGIKGEGEELEDSE